MAIDRLAKGYQPNFDLDARFGHQAVLFCHNIAEGIRDGSVEAKRDREALETGNVYVEYECRGKPSGIQTTSSEVWVFVVGTVLIAAPTQHVRQAARKAWKDPKNRKTCKRGSWPTRGVVIPVSEYLPRLIDEFKADGLDLVSGDAKTPPDSHVEPRGV